MRLRERGFELDIRRPPLGDALPESLDDHAGAIMFGGPMSANDGDEFVKRETDWLAVPLKENRPFLGICLGAQKLVRHLGGNVELSSRGPGGDRLLPALRHTGRPGPCSTGLKWFISGTGKDLICLMARFLWRGETPIPIRRSAMATEPTPCSFTPN